MTRSLPLLAGALLAAGCMRPASPAAPQGDAAAEAPRRYGDLMAEVGRRFERAGRAAEAGRWDLAAYDVGEIGEVFDDDIPHAPPPRETKTDIKTIAAAFARDYPKQLAQALATHDRATFAAAFARTAAACNTCHQASGHAFLEVPTVIGVPVPRLDPIASVAAPADGGRAGAIR